MLCIGIDQRSAAIPYCVGCRTQSKGLAKYIASFFLLCHLYFFSINWHGVAASCFFVVISALAAVLGIVLSGDLVYYVAIQI